MVSLVSNEIMLDRSFVGQRLKDAGINSINLVLLTTPEILWQFDLSIDLNKADWVFKMSQH